MSVASNALLLNDRLIGYLVTGS